MSVLALVAALLWSGAPNEVVARVDGTTITGAAFARRLEATASTYRTRPEQILDTMIDEALLATEGRRLGLEGSPIAKARFEFAQRTEAGAVFLRKEIEGRIAPDEKNLRSLFHSTADFAAFELLTFDTTERASGALRRRARSGGRTGRAPRGIWDRAPPQQGRRDGRRVRTAAGVDRFARPAAARRPDEDSRARAAAGESAREPR